MEEYKQKKWSKNEIKGMINDFAKSIGLSYLTSTEATVGQINSEHTFDYEKELQNANAFHMAHTALDMVTALYEELGLEYTVTKTKRVAKKKGK